LGDVGVPGVSVVVPSYQNARYIRETIDSILAQTYTDFELVVSDHSSTDGTWDIVSSYNDPRLRRWKQPAGGGAPANWNAATARARGQFIKLVCGDDLIAPNSLELQVAALEASPGAVLAASRRRIVDASGEPLISRRGLGPLTGQVPGSHAVRALVRAGTNLLGEPACVLVRRAALEAAGGWDGTHPYLIDQATYINVLAHGDLVALDETLASFRLSDTQWSVALAASQARQAVAVHRDVARRLPDAVSSWDVRLGNARARLMAVARRAAYLRWRKRMTATAAGQDA
jgi:glycosyltransferase involved in cell wall biosynthesis